MRSSLPVEAEPGPVGRGEWLWLAAILALAVVLRAVHLGNTLWYDEIDTLIRYVRLPTAELIRSYDSLNNHMFFSLQAQAAIAVLGESAWALRLPAAMMGVASIWALWLLARGIIGKEQALFAALLMAVSYHHVWFSQNARGYTGLLFFALLATHCLVRGARGTGWGPWLGYGACLALSMYTHLSSAFLFLAQGAALLAVLIAAAVQTRRFDWRILARALGGASLGIAATIALYAPVLGQIGGTFGKVQAGPEVAAKADSVAVWKSPLWMVSEIVASLGPVLAPALPVVVFVLLVAMVSLRRRAPLVPLSLVLHVAVTVALLMALSMRIWPRYFFVDLGFLCLLLVHGAYVIGVWLGRWRGWPYAGRALATLGIVGTLVLLPRNYMMPKQDFVGARDLVEGARGEGSRVLALGLTRMPYLDFYAPGWQGIDTLGDLGALWDGTAETWIVYTFPDVMESRHADIFAAIDGRFEKAGWFPGSLSGGGIVVLKSVSP